MKGMLTACLLAAALLSSGCSTHQLYGTSVALTAADWGQTSTIASQPEHWHEHNLILGRHPSEERVDLYFAAWMIINAIVYAEAPEKLSRPYFWLFNVVEVAAVGSNFNAGIGVKF